MVGTQLGLLTRNSRANAALTLSAIGLSGYFAQACIIGRDEARPKPAPDGILHLLGRWGVERETCVMVGDFRFDLEAGRNAGVSTVHVSPLVAPAWPALTDVRVASLAELYQRWSRDD